MLHLLPTLHAFANLAWTRWPQPAFAQIAIGHIVSELAQRLLGLVLTGAETCAAAFEDDFETKGLEFGTQGELGWCVRDNGGADFHIMRVML